MVITFTTGTSYFPARRCLRVSSALAAAASSGATAMRSHVGVVAMLAGGPGAVASFREWVSEPERRRWLNG